MVMLMVVVVVIVVEMMMMSDGISRVAVGSMLPAKGTVSLDLEDRVLGRQQRRLCSLIQRL